MQQQSDQEFTLNGLQLMNSNILLPTCLQSLSNLPVNNMQQPYSLGYNLQNVIGLNQSGVIINQPMLNQSNLMLNQQQNVLNQFNAQNQLMPTTGQQMFLTNLYNLNNSNKATTQLPLQTFFMTPTGLSSTIIGALPNQILNSKKRKKLKR